MENLEQYWEQSFSPIGRKFTEIRPDYQDMGETDSMVAALYWLELEMYNGGFLQFFCNWGYDAYLLAIKGLGAINATYTEQLLIQAYSIIQTIQRIGDFCFIGVRNVQINCRCFYIGMSHKFLYGS